MTIETNSDVADKVRGIAAEKRVTRADIATALSVSEMSVSRRFSGVTPFTAEELIKLGRRMGTPVGTFFGETSSSLPTPTAPVSGVLTPPDAGALLSSLPAPGPEERARAGS